MMELELECNEVLATQSHRVRVGAAEDVEICCTWLTLQAACRQSYRVKKLRSRGASTGLPDAT